MNELEQALTGDSAHAAPDRILESLTADIVHRKVLGAPHTIYQELWHICFWLQISLDWMSERETAYPARPSDAFPNESQTEAEPWPRLHQRFFDGIQHATSFAGDSRLLAKKVQCPSRPGMPSRTMNVQEQLDSLAAHTAYHFGRIVLLRPLCGSWPPPSGGFTW